MSWAYSRPNRLLLWRAGTTLFSPLLQHVERLPDCAGFTMRVEPGIGVIWLSGTKDIVSTLTMHGRLCLKKLRNGGEQAVTECLLRFSRSF